jgi:hypothetical protein
MWHGDCNKGAALPFREHFPPVLSKRCTLAAGAPQGNGTLWLASYTVPASIRRLLSLALLGLGIHLCLRACRTLEWRSVAHDMHHAGPWVVVLLLAPIVGNFVHMLGWRSLIERNWRPSLWRAFRIFVAAQAGNELGTSVLGESVKILAFAPDKRSAAVRVVLWDNVTALVAVALSLLSVFALSPPVALGPALRRVLAVLTLVYVAVAVGAWILSAGKLASRPPVSNMLFALLAHFLAKLWVVVEFALALGLLATASWYSSALLGFAATLASCIGAPVPGQLGVIESTLVAFASSAHVNIATVLSVAVLRRARSLLWVLLGAAFLFALGITTKSVKSNDPTAAI